MATSQLRNPRLLGYAAAGGFFICRHVRLHRGYAVRLHWLSPLSPQLYGVLFAIGIVGIMLTNQLNAQLVERFGSDRLLLAGTSWNDFAGLPGLILPLFLFVSATGLIVANSISGALSGLPHNAGAISALIGAIQYGSGIFGSALVGFFADGTPWPMGWVIALCGADSLISARLLLPTPRQGQQIV